MSGAVGYGWHEGSRSEYLAQYVFASWGTAVAIPHQEDHGVDLSCTLMERVGQRYLARWPYTVQVKSGHEPLVYQGKDEVRWLIEHPLPLYLCVVDKQAGRVSVYHTFPRFYTWAIGQLPERIELIPEPANGTPGRCTQWNGTWSFGLDQPILDFTVTQMLDNEFWGTTREVFEQWVCAENDNLTRIRVGLLKCRMPDEYLTNQGPVGGWAEHSLTQAEEGQLERVKHHLKESLEWVGAQLQQRQDLRGAACVVLLHRHLFGSFNPGILTPGYRALRERFFPGQGGAVRAGADHLAALIDEAITGGKG